MSREAYAEAPARQARPVKRGIVTGTLAAITGFAGAALLAALMSVLLEWTGIALAWWPPTHARDLLFVERGYIEAIDEYPLSPLQPTQLTALAWAQLDSGITWLGLNATLGQYAIAAINTVKLLTLRLIVVGLALPGYALAVTAGLIEGLVARDIRKFTGGHESAYVFHKAKRWIVPSVVLTVTVYLMLPIAVAPVAVFAPTMGLAALMVYIAASRFKKFV